MFQIFGDLDLYPAFSDSNLQNKRIRSESGDKEILEAANHSQKIPSSQPYFLC